MTLNGIDIASYQQAMDVTKITADFVIVKATEGTGYINPSYLKHTRQVVTSGKLLGVYHFLRNDSDVKKQADFFIKTVKPYIGQAVLALDVENTTGSKIENQAGVNLAKQWLDYVFTQTGVRPLLYTNVSCENNLDWSAIVKGNYGLWLAQYNNYNPVQGYQPRNLYGTLKHWKSMTIFQYTSVGRHAGYSGNVDTNVFYGEKAAWLAYARTSKVTDVPSEPSKKPISTIAKEVIAGKWGNEPNRSGKLKAAGYDPKAVQAEVNKQLKPSANPAPSEPATSGWIKQNGTFTVTTPSGIVMRSGSPSVKSNKLAVLKKGSVVKYDAFCYAQGYVWICQPRGKGQYGYLPTGNASGSKRTSYWGNFK